MPVVIEMCLFIHYGAAFKQSADIFAQRVNGLVAVGACSFDVEAYGAVDFHSEC